MEVTVHNSGPTTVILHCPIPLVISLLKRARELGGRERPAPFGPSENGPRRHTLVFVFSDTGNGDIYFDEVNHAISQWERENEPEDEPRQGCAETETR